MLAGVAVAVAEGDGGWQRAGRGLGGLDGRWQRVAVGWGLARVGWAAGDGGWTVGLGARVMYRDRAAGRAVVIVW